MNKPARDVIAELQSALHDSKLSKTEYIRVQAVLMRKLKQKRSVIATVVGKSMSVVEDWITAYNNHGLKALRTHTPKRNNRAALSLQQNKRLVSLLKKKPCEIRMGTEDYWTMSAVKKLVEKETGVVYKSVNSYRKLLKMAGMSYQKVEFVDQHQNQELHDGFQKQFEAKVKGGRISMWW